MQELEKIDLRSVIRLTEGLEKAVEDGIDNYIDNNTYRRRNDTLKQILRADLENKQKELQSLVMESGQSSILNQRRVEDQRAIGSNRSLVKLIKENPVLTMHDNEGSILLTDEKAINNALLLPELNKLKLLKIESLKEKNFMRSNLVRSKNQAKNLG